MPAHRTPQDGAWFAAKRHGFGAGWPIAWQGWALLAGYVAVMFMIAELTKPRPMAHAVLFIVATALLIIMAKAKTRGGWKWRWDKSDGSKD